MDSLCLLSTKLGVRYPWTKKEWGDLFQMEWVHSKPGSAYRALIPELQCLVPYTQPSPLTLWTVDRGFSVGALTISGERGPGSDLLRQW